MKYICEYTQCRNSITNKNTCSSCKGPRYCSEACRDSDWTEYHQYTCSFSSFQLTLSEFEELKTEESAFLGRGAYGEVRLLRHTQTRKLFAVKQISKQFLKRNGSIHLMVNEICIHKTLCHPNVIKLITYLEDAHYVYMLLEYAPCGSLSEKTRNSGALPEVSARHYFVQTCIGLKYLHSKNIIHRDIKPQNLLLDDNDTVKICDFGWCVQSEEQRDTVCGTLEYMAPEILSGTGHSFKADCWSLGILLYELLHGHTPLSQCGKNLPGQVVWSERVSAEARDLIEKLVKSDPSQRYSLDDVLRHPWVSSEPKSNSLLNAAVSSRKFGRGQVTEVVGLLCEISFPTGPRTFAVPEVAWELDRIEGPVLVDTSAQTLLERQRELELLCSHLQSHAPSFRHIQQKPSPSWLSSLFGCAGR